MWYDARSDETLNDGQLLDLMKSCGGQVVLLEGRTGCGKTAIMRRLMKEDGRKADFFSKDQFVRTLMDCIESNGRHTMREVVGGYGIVCIDDADLMHDTAYTQEYTAQILSDIAQDALVIVAGIRLRERIRVLIEHITAPVRLIEYRSEQNP